MDQVCFSRTVTFLLFTWKHTQQSQAPLVFLVAFFIHWPMQAEVTWMLHRKFENENVREV